jgi:uncharacterized protein YxjI
MKPRLIVEQKITAMVNKYAIYQAQEDGSKGQLVALAQQKRLAFKEKVQFYTDESKSQLAFTFRAEKVMDIHGRFLVEDAEGKGIGIFRKDFKKSLLNSTWHIVDEQDTVQLTVRESNETLAALRRFAGFIPVVGDIFEVVLLFFKYHFTLRDSAGHELGRYQKTTLFRDHYTLSTTDEAYTAQDWRTLAAVAVALDALQSR